MKNTRFYHVARALFAGLGMPDVRLAEGNAYRVVVDRRVEVRVVACGDEYLRFIAECEPLASNLDAAQLTALLNCNATARPFSIARVGICPESGTAVVHGAGSLGSDDPRQIRAAFDDVVALADQVLAIVAAPRDPEQDRHRPPGPHGNC